MALADLISYSFLGIHRILLLIPIIAISFIVYRYPNRPRIPYINKFPNDWLRTRAKAAFITRCADLVAEGRRKFDQAPFTLIAMFGERVVLPEEWLSWVAANRDLDHQAHVAEEFFGYLPGFEAVGAINDPHGFVVNLVKGKLSSMTPAMMESFQEVATDVLTKEFGNGGYFHAINWPAVCIKLISRMSASIFVGPELARDPKWQEITITYTQNMFRACTVLRTWPAPLRRLAVWWIPECKVCRDQIAEARALVAKHSRQQVSNETHIKGGGATAFDWMDPRADPAIIQLSLAMASIHTTSQLLNQTVLDLAYAAQDQNEIICELRKEVRDCLETSTGKFVPATLPKLGLLEACIKETQRLKPQTAVNLDRMAVRPVTLPNGVRLPAGTMVCVDATKMWREDVWGADADAWEPTRWFAGNDDNDDPATSTRALPAGEKLVNSSARHFAFGKGRFICPGRFMVNAELKVALSLILDGWDIRLSERDFAAAKASGRRRVDWVPYGFETLANEKVVVEVRRRVKV